MDAVIGTSDLLPILVHDHDDGYHQASLPSLLNHSLLQWLAYPTDWKHGLILQRILSLKPGTSDVDLLHLHLK